MKNKSVCVVVLDDVGRSTRMQYHAQSLLHQGFNVDIVGYTDSPVLDNLKAKATIIGIPKPLPFDKYFPLTIAFLFKVVWQTLTLSWAIFMKRKSDIVLVQNPPAIPTLAVCWFYCLLINATFIIDWHNYAYSMLALNLGSNSPLVKLSLFYEYTFGRLAGFNLCVNRAMKDDLYKNWNIKAMALYDCLESKVKTITLAEKQQLLEKMNLNFFIEVSKSGELQLKPDRPGLIVSSIRFNTNKDFVVLLNALLDYDDYDYYYPKLICVIIGDGPLKYYFQSKILGFRWKKVSIIISWLESDKIPILLACADFCVCYQVTFDRSPRKIVSMYAIGLRVFMTEYISLNRLIRLYENGLELDENQVLWYIMKWFKKFPFFNSIFDHIRFNFDNDVYLMIEWHIKWMIYAYPIFSKDDIEFAIPDINY